MGWIVKYFMKISICWKFLWGNGLCYIFYVVLCKMDVVFLGNRGVWVFNVWVLKIDMVVVRFVLIDMWFVVFDMFWLIFCGICWWVGRIGVLLLNFFEFLIEYGVYWYLVLVVMW